MGRVALVGGNSFLGPDGALPFAGASSRTVVRTPYGDVDLLDAGEIVVLQRHGLDGYRPPHLVDHRANFAALLEAGCDRVLAIASVGSLRTNVGVGAMVCPDDFVALHLGLSAYDDARGHRVPGFDREWRRRVLSAWASSGEGRPRDGGVYWQAIGPRLETVAEIRLIAAHADVIGMTIASECVVAGEVGIAYAAVCVVDNLAHGLDTHPLTIAELAASRDAHQQRLLRDLDEVVPALTTLAG